MPKAASRLLRLDAERGVEQQPGAGVEEFEEARIEHDAGRVAVAPGDGQLPAEDERGHACGLRCSAFRLLLFLFGLADGFAFRPAAVLAFAFAFVLRLRLRGSGHSRTSCARSSTGAERRRVRSARFGASGICGEVSSATISQSRSSGSDHPAVGRDSASAKTAANIPAAILAAARQAIFMRVAHRQFARAAIDRIAPAQDGVVGLADRAPQAALLEQSDDVILVAPAARACRSARPRLP